MKIDFLPKRFIRLWCIVPLIVFIAGYLLPYSPIIPVKNATPLDWHPKSFWKYPWGQSGTHKGIDIFAPEGTPIEATTSGFILSTGDFGMGGNGIILLGAQWKLHYYAHLQSYNVHVGQWVRRGAPIGKVGTTGNAVGKSPHLHYSIVTLIPYLWRWDDSPQGWKKIFYLNPATELPNTFSRRK